MDNKLYKCGATALHDNIVCGPCWARLTSVISHDGNGGAIYTYKKPPSSKLLEFAASIDFEKIEKDAEKCCCNCCRKRND